MSTAKYDVETDQPITSFCVIAFLYATISLVAVRDWDTGKEKKYFFSVQVFFFFLNNPHGAVGVGRKPI